MREALENEKNEALRRITNYLTPRIRGEIPVGIQEREECEAENKQLSNRIAEIETELESMESLELPDHEDVKPEQILATVDDLPLVVFAKSEDAAILIQCEAESIVENIKKAHALVVSGLNNKLHVAAELELSLRQRNAELVRERDASNDACKELVEENRIYAECDVELRLERDQALQYRDNAVEQLEEMKFEYEQMKIELNRNQEVRALSEAERTAEQEAAKKRWEESLIKVYNIRFEDEYKINTTWKLANVAETGEEVRYRADYEKGLYIEITEDEALAIQAMNKPVTPPAIEEIAEETFQEETDTASDLPEAQQIDEQENSGNHQSSLGENAEVVETWNEWVERTIGDLYARMAQVDGNQIAIAPPLREVA